MDRVEQSFNVDDDLAPSLRPNPLHPPLPPAQALSNCMWGLSKLEIRADDLMTAIGAAASAQLWEFNAQNLANLVGGRGYRTSPPAAGCMPLVLGVPRGVLPSSVERRIIKPSPP